MLQNLKKLQKKFNKLKNIEKRKSFYYDVGVGGVVAKSHLLVKFISFYRMIFHSNQTHTLIWLYSYIYIDVRSPFLEGGQNADKEFKDKSYRSSPLVTMYDVLHPIQKKK